MKINIACSGERMKSKPDFLAHALGIEKALSSVRDLSRELSQHWPTDGEHREAILKKIISKKIPRKYIVSSGFIVGDDETSPQVDVLIYDSESPVFEETEDGKVFVTADAVVSMTEVKSRLSGKKAMVSALSQIAKAAKMCGGDVWTGLFVHEGEFDLKTMPDRIVLEALEEVDSKYEIRINCAILGSSIFVRYWENSHEAANGVHHGPAWHSYFIDRLAPAYYIGNLVAEIARIPDEHAFKWFPIPDKYGKESRRLWFLPVGGKPTQFGHGEDRVKPDIHYRMA